MDEEADLNIWIEAFCREEATYKKEMQMFADGERVIFTHPDPALDGQRGTVITGKEGGIYEIAFDNGETWNGVWESKLERESEYPHYPQSKA